MTKRWTIVALVALHGACGGTDQGRADHADVAMGDAQLGDAQAEASLDTDASADVERDAGADAHASTGASILVATNANLSTTSVVRTPTRLFSALIWTGMGSHQTLSLFSFAADGSSPRALGGMFYRHGTSVPPLARSSVAAQGDAVLVAHQRLVWQDAVADWASATGVVRFSADGSTPPPAADYRPGTPTVLAGVTMPELAPSVVARGDGFSVLDMTADRRLRLTTIDRAGAVVGQQHFALPFALSSTAAVRRWAVQARGETFVVASDDEAWRLFEVSERGLVNGTESIRPISRVQSRPSLCVGDGDAFEFAQSAENSATLWALDRSPAMALRSAPLEPARPLRGCVAPGLWLRSIASARLVEGADLWDADRGAARCQPELSLRAAGVERTVDVAGPVAIAADLEGDGGNLRASIVLRSIPLHGCIAGR